MPRNRGKATFITISATFLPAMDRKLTTVASTVLSFMSQWGGPPRSPTSGEGAGTASSVKQDNYSVSITQSSSSHKIDSVSKDSPSPSQQQRQRSDSRPNSRPTSMLQTYQPPTMDVAQDTLPELQPIF